MILKMSNICEYMRIIICFIANIFKSVDKGHKRYYFWQLIWQSFLMFLFVLLCSFPNCFLLRLGAIGQIDSEFVEVLNVSSNIWFFLLTYSFFLQFWIILNKNYFEIMLSLWRTAHNNFWWTKSSNVDKCSCKWIESVWILLKYAISRF